MTEDELNTQKARIRHAENILDDVAALKALQETDCIALCTDFMRWDVGPEDAIFGEIQEYISMVIGDKVQEMESL